MADKTDLLIKGQEVTISSESLDEFTGQNLFVFVETYTIDGAINLPGRNVNIHARNVICKNNAEINVSGPLNERTFTKGNTGKDGHTGDLGFHGGNVIIICENLTGDLKINSSGGKGGKGGDGGDGKDGSDGSPGRNGSTAEKQWPDGSSGGDGGNGGDSGRGGKGGDGGDAGTISIKIQNELRDRIVFIAKGGLGGDPGDSGDPGSGGKGGTGGKSYICKYFPLPAPKEQPERFEYRCTLDRTEANGRNGNPGRKPSNLGTGDQGQSNYLNRDGETDISQIIKIVPYDGIEIKSI